MQNIWHAFSFAAKFILPILFLIDLLVTHLINRHYSNIKSSYYKLQQNFGNWLALLGKTLFFLFAMECASSQTIGMGRTSNAFIPIVYMITVPVYTLEFIRHRWRVKHGLEPAMHEASEGNEQDKSTD